MPRLGPISRNELVRGLRRLGFEGPYSGGRHQFMVREEVSVRLPNPHRADVGVELLLRVLRQAGIGRAEWEELEL